MVQLDKIFNPITNKMVKRTGKRGKSLLANNKFIAGSKPAFIENESFWDLTENGDSVYKCTRECFPFDINSDTPCLPRCVYTNMKGHHEYTHFYSFFVDKKPVKNNKTIIITYGPPSSGNGSLDVFLRHILQVDPTNMVDANVDSIFQNKKLQIGTEYLKQVETIKQNFPPDKHQLYNQRLYNYYRWVADQISDLILTTAMINKMNIKWETSGNSTFTYLKNWIEQKLKHDYKVILIYPLVSRENLLLRIRERERKTKQTPATENKIDKMIQMCNENFEKLKSIQNPNLRLIQIDNNTKIDNEYNRVILYDSHSTENTPYASSCVIT